MPFDLSNYATVEERLALFWADHPNGRITTELVAGDITTWCLFRAAIYRNHDDHHPVATGYAFEERTERGVNQTSWIENAETSSLGRAAANWVYQAGKRPSREEMQKVERMGGQMAETGPKPATPAQIKLLRSLRYPGDPTTLSAQQASRHIDALKQQANDPNDAPF